MSTRKILAGGISLLVVVGLVATIVRAGPLSDVEVASRLHGIPTEMQVVGCSSGSATASSAIPQGSLVRVTLEGSKGIYYNFVAQSGTVTLTNGAYLNSSTVPEYIQNGVNQWFACITRGSDAATASLAVMK